MKKRYPILTGLVLLLGGLLLYIYEPPFMIAMSRQLYDVMLNTTARPVQTESAAIVDIDDASLEEYGQWPWSRYVLADLLERLWEQGAAVVVFDVIFIESDRTSPEELCREWQDRFGTEVTIQGLPEGMTDFDARMAEAMRGGPVVLGCFMDLTQPPPATLPQDHSAHYQGHYFEMGQPDRSWLPQAGAVLYPIDALSASAATSAFINTLPDYDNVIRRTPLLIAYGPSRIYASLSLEAIRLYLGEPNFGLVYDTAGTDGIQKIKMRAGEIPTDRNGRFFINYRSTRFPSWSVGKVLKNQVPEGALQDRIVFIGTSAAGMQDLRMTPLREDFPGVEVHATVVDNIFAGDILREPRWVFYANFFAILFGGILLTVLVTCTPAFFSFLVMALADSFVIASSFWMLKAWQLVALPFETVFIWGGVFLGVIGVKYWQEEHEQQKVRNMFGTMVSSSVLRYLEENPGSFSLSGAKAEATMFFSDVAGFTTISESIPPEQLAELLNRYLSPMTKVIMDHGGYVDKYEGDAIMAEWGVPFPMPDHATQACNAALEQMAELERIRPELKEEYGHELHVRMGINTGTVTAGNMGSETRFQYTVMGDAVNQASRYESANKGYGTQIMIGESTRAAVGDQFEVRLLDLLVVKGKTRPIKVYELLGVTGQVEDRRLRVRALYEEALNLHWDRRFAEAVELLEQAQEIMPDEASRLLEQRIRRYIENPPPEDWKGEFVNLSK